MNALALLAASLAVVAAGVALASWGTRFAADLDNQPYRTAWWISLSRLVLAAICVLGGAAVAITGIVAAMTNIVALAGWLT